MKRIVLIAIGVLAFIFYSTADAQVASRTNLSQAANTSFNFNVTSATLSNSSGAITVTGTIVCPAGDVYEVVANIVQAGGNHRGLTGGITLNTCSGGVDTWVVPQGLNFGSISNGSSQIVAEAIDATDGNIAEQVVSQPVTPVP
jgi:hypothetical protein